MVTNAPSPVRLSAKPLEELGQKRAGLDSPDAVAHLGAMVQSGILRDVVQRPSGPCLGIGGPVHETSETGRHRRPGAHRAWFQGDEKRVAGESPVAGRSGRRRHDQHLGVGGGVGQLFAAVVIRRHQVAVPIDQHSSNRNLALIEGQPGLIESESHPVLVVILSEWSRGHERVDYGNPKCGRDRLWAAVSVGSDREIRSRLLEGSHSPV
jgi:hypothetical protein